MISFVYLSALLFFLICPFICSSSKLTSFPSYFDVSFGKCDGMFLLEYGRIKFNKTSELFIQEIVNSSSIQCQWVCSRELENCRMIEYIGLNCRLYKSDSIEISGPDLVDLWKCPKPVCVTFPKRCPAYWVGYDKYKSINDRLIPVNRIDNTTKFECQTLCERNINCGSFTFYCFDSNRCSYSLGVCTLYFGYLKPITEKLDSQIYNDSMTLRCCDNDEVYYKQQQMTRIMGKKYENVTGQWNVVKFKNKYHYNLSIFQNIVATKLICLDYKECIETCSKEPFCLTPIFVNGQIPICYLHLDQAIGNFKESSSIIDDINNTDSVIWEWRTNQNHKNNTHQTSMFGSCICFQKGRKLFIQKSCNSKYTDIVVSSTLNLYLKGFLNDHARKNQIFSMSDGHNMYTIRVDNIFKEEICEFENCDKYSEKIYNNDIQQFVNRTEWLAVKPKEENPHKLPADMLIILNTYRPNGRCFSRSLCSAYVRDFQNTHFNKKFSDIAYNFLIGEDGRIYIGRGWHLIGAHTRGYNFKSIGVAFIGWFKFVEPNSKALIALRNLIQLGIKNNYLKSNFKLTTNRALRSSDTPGEKLYRIIGSWSFMNLTEYTSCNRIDDGFNFALLIIPIVLVLFLLIGISYAFQKTFHFHKPCQKLKKYLTSKENKFKYYNMNIYKMETEKVNMSKDWIYFCQEMSGNKLTQCNCFEYIRGLWMFCYIKPEINFMNRLHDLFHTLNCSYIINIYVEKSKSLSDSKSIVLFHMKCNNPLLDNSILTELSLDKFCLCKRFLTKKIPQTSHGKMEKFINNILQESS